jgi:hypothetical protein
MEKITFEELLNLDWKYSDRNDREDYHLKVLPENPTYKGETVGVLVNFEQCWTDHCPVSHAFTPEVNNKVANMFLHAKDMYKLLASMDTKEAKELIEKINESNPINEEPEDEDE